MSLEKVLWDEYEKVELQLQSASSRKEKIALMQRKGTVLRQLTFWKRERRRQQQYDRRNGPVGSPQRKARLIARIKKQCERRAKEQATAEAKALINALTS